MRAAATWSELGGNLRPGLATRTHMDARSQVENTSSERTVSSATTVEISPPPAATIDAEGFRRALDELRRNTKASLGERDLAHIRKMERWGRLCSAMGYATAWIAPNPVSAYLISQGNVAQWLIMMHHVSHGAFDHVPGVPERYKGDSFARGNRRYVDWLDWVLPDAWREDHNVLHHYRTNELLDPDLVEENVRFIRNLRAPASVKLAAIGFSALTWKFSYVAPSMFEVLYDARRRRAGLSDNDTGRSGAESSPRPRRKKRWYRAFVPPWTDSFDPRNEKGREFWRRGLLPYGLTRFALMPALFLPIGPFAAANVLANSVLAEAITNVHSFLIITTNHTGDDVHRYEGRPRGRADFYMRQVMGSVNLTGGGNDLKDFLFAYLNYQIEHHLFPDMPPLRYREIQPQVKAICAEYNVPYVEGSLPSRVSKLFQILLGQTSMKRVPEEDSTC